ncbi:hypothetical protein LTR82_001579 [Friedmanniomyces endolithicus]|uniref:Uncharacterized protein n=1 Tax=Friedmanniomyces endolithicus TaxID=329885 RepID=A0AAN6G145_9PEZI|nr:hypothetical protein LTR82_001579 [Friedmanniomyces endolithicus]
MATAVLQLAPVSTHAHLAPNDQAWTAPQPAPTSRSKARRQSVNATMLAAKLHALQLKRIDIMPQEAAGNRNPSKRASYVPRHAAQMFTATTTPAPSSNESRDMERAKSGSQRRQSVFATDNEKLCINPKQLHAALSLGMSENEALTSIPAIPSPPSDSDKQQRLASGIDERRRQSVGTGYKPGDAAKRNALKRQSLQVTQQGTPIAIALGSHTTREQDGAPVSSSVLSHADPSHEHDTSDPRAQAYLLNQAHLIRPRDRPDWTQQSQCGDETRHYFRHERRDSKVTRPTVPRQKSLGAIAEKKQADAIPAAADNARPVQSDKKVKRRSSFVAFFRRW